MRIRLGPGEAAVRELQRHRAFWHQYKNNGTPTQRRLVEFLGKAASQLVRGSGK